MSSGLCMLHINKIVASLLLALALRHTVLESSALNVCQCVHDD